ncbi:hypothetical protein WOLCODRAFT_135150 [Wolfiporia cocos MD-104 SS10]|uniref:Trypsin-like serine protease n=1 Tax=Wolfiporia cocos (strain MD-104) TaxID=742152 RepID=A0A2H3J118_WOLCO|nr:hypothetical protein WOLCODRAFT_135150 [Wolfiporia cocos MD-104 SS10]
MALRQTALASRSRITSSLSSAACLNSPSARAYATVGTTTYIGQPPPPPTPPPAASSSSTTAANLSSVFDAQILYELRRRCQLAPGSSTGSQVQLPKLVEQYLDRGGLVLDSSLPYESRPGKDRRIDVDESAALDSVAMIVHAAQQGAEHKITHCSGFALSAPGLSEGQSVMVTCAHTLEEIRHSPILRRDAPPNANNAALPSVSGSFVITGPSSSPTFSPVSSILSSLHRSDLLLMSAPPSPFPALRTLPVSPYPAQPGARIRAHFVTHKEPVPGAGAEGWRPWVGGTWSKWIRGTVLGYRDMAGREAKPGTYDALSHLLFDPTPTPGSSGGPIIDEESGAVIGVVLGTQMQNRLQGVCGWGVPSEMIFEMFSLPGLKLNNRS